MRLSLIGMSGCGKSYWSKELQKRGFKKFCCDDFIGKKICNKSSNAGSCKTADIAKWMGQPFDPQYERTSKEYLASELEGMDGILAGIKKSSSSENIVIDTTGSVIYLGEELLNRLSVATKVIYLEIPSSFIEEMYMLYRKDPKPVIWGNVFNKREGETDFEALARCYPDLLAFRVKKYKKLADITLDYNTLHKPGFTIDQFIQTIEND